ncbi:MAG: hypothetical protein H0V29_08985 [Thermoleophilaceae bacterium]|nr:hypothetical protein [Thermoleophilaceae bacterium]
MSGIAGIFHGDGRPVDPADVAIMTASMRHRGPDGIEQTVSGPVGMGHCSLRTLPGRRDGTQPVWDEAGVICVALDGRIDNGYELRTSLGAEQAPGGESDAELLMRAYGRWGEGSVARLVGDFAFSLWDGRRRELLCARDFLGKRPLYYAHDGTSFRWASEPQAVLADPALSREPNLGMIGEYLSADVRSTTDTLFRDLFRLAPAHYLLVGPRGVEIARYWEWAPGPPLHYRDEREYAAHLLSVCGDAAAGRLETSSGVAVELSGGLDSSSVIGIVEHLREQGRHDTPVEAYSLVFPGLPCDETDHIRTVVAHCGVRSHELRPAATPAEEYETQARRYLDLPEYPNGMQSGLFEAALAAGSRVLFTGTGPDEWLTGSLFSYIDLVRRLRIRRLAAEVRSEAEVWGWRESLRLLWRYGLRAQVPAGLRSGVARTLGRSTCPPWLRADFCLESGLEERLQRLPRHGEPGPGQLDDGWRAHATESAERARAAAGMEARDLFDDRRVVEYVLALPHEQLRRGHVTKHVLRQAVAGLIPESVRSRSDKADFSYAFREELRLHGGPALFRDLAMEDLGWVDGLKVRDMYAEFERGYSLEAGPKNGQVLWQLWLISSMERWLRAL